MPTGSTPRHKSVLRHEEMIPSTPACRWHRALSGLWLVILLAAAAWLCHAQPWQGRLDTDLLALLPHDERNPSREAALQALSAQGERQLALLVQAAGEDEALRAASMVRESIAGLALIETRLQTLFPGDFYFPYRHVLMTERDQDWLASATPEAATARARARAHALFSPSPVPWRDDPYGFFGNWLMALADASPLRPAGNELMVRREGHVYVALLYSLPHSAFDSQFQQRLLAGLASAEDRLRQALPHTRLLRAGVVLHAAAAASQAESDMRLIGAISLLGVLLLIGLVFQSGRALQLIAVSLFAGAIVALAASFLLFARVHLLTLVFGASLIGVAADYAILVFAEHLGNTEPVWTRYRRLLPTLAMVLIAPSLAYFSLALTPFPGLKQMAVFAVCGIAGAWMSVACFYPYLLPANLPLPQNARRITHLLSAWPRWQGCRRDWAMACCLVAVMAGGLWQLRANDDIRSLFEGNAGLLREHAKIADILRLPSPAQMFIVTGPSPEALLQKEEALLTRIQPLVDAAQIGGFTAVSRWLPSLAMQQKTQELTRRLQLSRTALAAELDLPAAFHAGNIQSHPLLTPAEWLASPVSDALRPLWLGNMPEGDARENHVSIVLLQGLANQEAAARLAALPASTPQLDGVMWVDQTAAISALMARYRHLLSAVLGIACLVTPCLLFLFFRGAVWRIMLPVVTAGGMTLAIMGYLGIPIQLLSLLALLLTLGMGVDYALFLQARASHAHTLLATTLAASLTLLSFGMLALSGTPALRALGLTTTLGVTLSWLLTPITCGPTEPARQGFG
jgi:predicted exporter